MAVQPPKIPGNPLEAWAKNSFHIMRTSGNNATFNIGTSQTINVPFSSVNSQAGLIGFVIDSPTCTGTFTLTIGNDVIIKDASISNFLNTRNIGTVFYPVYKLLTPSDTANFAINAVTAGTVRIDCFYQLLIDKASL